MRTRDWAAIDYYAVLGVEPTASTEEIAGAFRGLAKRLHPDRPEADGADGADAERFTTVVAAYEVLGEARLRRAYDEVRFDAAARRPQPARTATMPSAAGAPAPELRLRVVEAGDPRRALRNARRWLAAGVGVFLAGVVVSAVVVRLQAHDHARRVGRVKTEAVIVATGAGNDIRFTTAGGDHVQVPEPERVNPGTNRDGSRVTVLYRPADPRDVVLNESTVARNITLWIVAAKLLVGGVVFVGVGLRGRRRIRRARRT